MNILMKYLSYLIPRKKKKARRKRKKATPTIDSTGSLKGAQRINIMNIPDEWVWSTIPEDGESLPYIERTRMTSKGRLETTILREPASQDDV